MLERGRGRAEEVGGHQRVVTDRPFRRAFLFVCAEVQMGEFANRLPLSRLCMACGTVKLVKAIRRLATARTYGMHPRLFDLGVDVEMRGKREA
jgi:hypothetical protein